MNMNYGITAAALLDMNIGRFQNVMVMVAWHISSAGLNPFTPTSFGMM